MLSIFHAQRKVDRGFAGTIKVCTPLSSRSWHWNMKTLEIKQDQTSSRVALELCSFSLAYAILSLS